MINEKGPAITKFGCTVSDLCRVIDARIADKDYGNARCMVTKMETILKKIVTSMFLHDHIDERESDLIMMFIRHIAADKRKIIEDADHIRYLEFNEDDAIFEQVRETWNEYTMPPFDEESHQTDSKGSKAINNRWRDDDDEDDL